MTAGDGAGARGHDGARRRGSIEAHAGGRAPARGAHRVLLVDTDVAFRDELERALGRFGLALVWRARVLGLSDAVAEHDPIAVILSADLAGGDPVELLRQLRSRADQARRAIFIVGDEISRELALGAYARGADAVLDRGAAIPELAARLLGRAHLRARERRGTAKSVADAAIALCDASAAGAGSGRENGAAPPREPVAAPAPPPVAGFAGLGPQYRGSPPPDAPRVPLAATPPSPRAVPDVVLVEDDPALLEMLRHALTNRGYSTLSFSNGPDALRCLRELDTAGRRPVVLLDVGLPGLDGFRILHELGGARPGAYHVILCTVRSGEATPAPGNASGAPDYLTRPLRIPIFLAKVERLLGRGSLSAAAGG